MAIDDEVRLTLRLPVFLRDKLLALSDSSGRSMNAEIVTRLERSISFEDEYGSIEEIMKDIFVDIEALQEKVREHDELLRNY